jgi:hypothetical protein
MSPTVSELMHIIPHNLLSDERMWAHPCCTHTPRSRTGTAVQGAWRMLQWVRERSRSRLTVNYGCWIVVFVWCNYLTILYRTPLYSKDVTFIYVPWVIICVRLDPITHLIPVRVWPLNSGVIDIKLNITIWLLWTCKCTLSKLVRSQGCVGH